MSSLDAVGTLDRRAPAPAGLCPECWRNGVAASLRGPTCTHHEAGWWPMGWAQMDEGQRVEWIRSRRPVPTQQRLGGGL